MTLERLWAGWRAGYVSGAGVADQDGDDQGCVLCRVIDDGSNVVWRSPLCAVLLNAFPYTSGHLLVTPVRHVAEMEDLDQEESAQLWRAMADAVTALKSAYRPDGLNLGANLGRSAGAGVPGHFHVHVLPRWNGDTNFMTTVAEARVLPESLPATHQRVSASWPS